MEGGVFLVKQGGELVQMRKSEYASEDVLQALLARYPSLLVGDQINPEAPRRWLLISREVGVPDTEDGAGRWALDHLFLDQDGIPTLVEVKRSSDTRLRREMVGQLLDYAANALAYWPVERVRTCFESRCKQDDVEADDELIRFLGESTDAERFWATVKTNLQAGRLRLVFVADVIPRELQRIIEYLNGQMNSTEVIGIAIQQFVSSDQSVYVPRVVGQTAAAARAKSPGASSEKRQWDEASFMEDLRQRNGEAFVEIAHRILEWGASRNLTLKWGQGKVHGTFWHLICTTKLLV